MKGKVVPLVLLVLLVLTVLLPAAAAAGAAGRFTSVEGNVDVTSPGRAVRPAATGDTVATGDVIRTKSASRCEIALADGSVLRLAQGSRVRISEFSLQPGGRNATLDLYRGKIQNVVKSLGGEAASRSRYEIQTPTAVCGVRGTSFFVHVHGTETSMVFQDGSGYGYSRNRPSELQPILAGQAMVVSDPDRPPVIRPAGPLEMEQHQKDTKPSEKAGGGRGGDEGKRADGPEGGTPAGNPAAGGQGAPSGGDSAQTRADAAPEGPLSPPAAPPRTALSTGSSAGPAGGPAAGALPTVTPPFGDSAPDTAPPVITLSGTPAAITNETTAAIAVSANEPASFSYTLDGGPVASPLLQHLSAGRHTFTVTATDKAGNRSVASHEWLIDLVPPVVTLTGTPAAFTKETAAAIGVSANKPVSFSYTLDGRPAASPFFQNLPAGEHAFSVTATDAAGNRSVVSHEWTIDPVPPAIGALAPKIALTADGKAELALAPTADEPVHFSTTLDGGSPAAGAAPQLGPLAAGGHAVSVQATDRAGNTASRTLEFTLVPRGLQGSFHGCIGDVYGAVTGQLAAVPGQEWGGWRLSMTGDGNAVPRPSWTLFAGGGNPDDGYWLSTAPGTSDFERRTLAGVSQLRTLSLATQGHGTGAVTGSFDGQGRYELVDAGSGRYSETPLLCGSRIAGDLFAQNRVTIQADQYVRIAPDLFEQGRVENLHVRSADPARPPASGFQMARIDAASGGKSDWVYLFWPNGDAVGYTSSNNTPRMISAPLSRLSVSPDLSASPPLYPPAAEFGFGAPPAAEAFLDNDWPVTGPVPSGPDRYTKVHEAEYHFDLIERLPPPSAATDPALSGIMGVHALAGGPSSLWSSERDRPLGLSFLGGLQPAAPPLLFRVPGFFSRNDAAGGDVPAPTPDGGAYFGLLSGTVARDRTVAAVLYGLYVSPDRDGFREAGWLKTTAPVAGRSYPEIGLWEAAGSLYRVPKAQGGPDGPIVPAARLFEPEESGGFAHIDRGAIGDFTLESPGIAGRFETGGKITTLAAGGFGSTLSLQGLPDFGLFEMLHGGIGNRYENPAGSWKLAMAGTGQFGSHARADGTRVDDFGFWHASVDGAPLDGSESLSGTLGGHFLSYKKEGVLAGDFLGSLKPESADAGLWQGVSAGVWEKRRDVAFSSGIVGYNHSSGGGQIHGTGGPDHHYSIGTNPDGSYRHAHFTSRSGSELIRIEYERQGPPGQEGYAVNWWSQQQTGTSGTELTLLEARTLTAEEFTAGIDALRVFRGSANETADAYRIGGHTRNEGILAGFGTLWNESGGGVKAEELLLVGRYGQEGGVTPTLFGGTVTSFDPQVDMNPYSHSRSPVGGAYMGFLGAAFGKRTTATDRMDGLISGLYLDPAGHAGILSGTFRGDSDPRIGSWRATGGIGGGYALGLAGGGLTEALFAQSLLREEFPDRSYGYNDVATAGDAVRLRALGGDAALAAGGLFGLPPGGYFGVWQRRAAGSWEGAPAAWSWEIRAGQYPGAASDHIAVRLEPDAIDGVRSGELVGATVRHPTYAYTGTEILPATAIADGGTTGDGQSAAGVESISTAVMAGTIKGLFDPNQSWQAIAQGSLVETATFLRLVEGMTTDAERRAFTDATKIPCFTVGSTSLAGSGNGMDVRMDDVGFFASSVGSVPKIWATSQVSGRYAGTPALDVPIGLSATNGISASFSLRQWTGSGWSATVNGIAPVGTIGGQTQGAGGGPGGNTVSYGFQGGAAGIVSPAQTITAGPGGGTFSGTAAGIVTPIGTGR